MARTRTGSRSGSSGTAGSTSSTCTSGGRTRTGLRARWPQATWQTSTRRSRTCCCGATRRPASARSCCSACARWRRHSCPPTRSGSLCCSCWASTSSASCRCSRTTRATGARSARSGGSCLDRPPTRSTRSSCSVRASIGTTWPCSSRARPMRRSPARRLQNWRISCRTRHRYTVIRSVIRSPRRPAPRSWRTRRWAQGTRTRRRASRASASRRSSAASSASTAACRGTCR